LFIGHIGGMDCCARGLKAAARMLEDGVLTGMIDARYAKWDSAEGKAMLKGKRTLDEIAARVEKKDINPEPVSGRQELLENIVNRYV
jgi:xylose isomerase